jgi:hypothetical protein
MNIICFESFCPHKTHNKTLIFRTLLENCGHFDYWNQRLNMRMRICYLDCHEAGLCCYLVIHIETYYVYCSCFTSICDLFTDSLVQDLTFNISIYWRIGVLPIFYMKWSSHGQPFPWMDQYNILYIREREIFSLYLARNSWKNYIVHSTKMYFLIHPLSGLQENWGLGCTIFMFFFSPSPFKIKMDGKQCPAALA